MYSHHKGDEGSERKEKKRSIESRKKNKMEAKKQPTNKNINIKKSQQM